MNTVKKVLQYLKKYIPLMVVSLLLAVGIVHLHYMYRF